MKFIIGVIVVVTVINSVQGRFVKRKRQLSCLLTYSSLNSDEKSCVAINRTTLSLDISVLEKLCSSEICFNTAKKLIKPCKVSPQSVMTDYTERAQSALYNILLSMAMTTSTCTHGRHGTESIVLLSIISLISESVYD